MSLAEDRLHLLRRVDAARSFEEFTLRKLELTWIDATCLYEVYDTPVLSDASWDKLTRYLAPRYPHLSSYFRYAVPEENLISTTGSGIDWASGILALSVANCKIIISMLKTE